MLRIESRLNGLINRQFGSTGAVRSLSDLGIRIVSGGNLEFDQDVFDDAVAADPNAVREFFLASGAGAADGLEDRLDSLTDTVDGLFTTERNSVQNTIDSLTDRIEQIDSLLAVRQERLLQEFINMERAIGQLQSQQDALSALSQIATQQNQKK